MGQQMNDSSRDFKTTTMCSSFPQGQQGNDSFPLPVEPPPPPRTRLQETETEILQSLAEEEKLREAIQKGERELQAMQEEISRLLRTDPEGVHAELIRERDVRSSLVLPSLKGKLDRQEQNTKLLQQKRQNCFKQAGEKRQTIGQIEQRLKTYYPAERAKLQGLLSGLAFQEGNEKKALQKLRKEVEELIGERS